jgi:hypothetical protein
MNSRTTRRFREMLAQLPSPVQRQAHDAYQLFRTNPQHPGLHFKRIRPDPPIYSARVGIGYRAVGLLDGDTIVWYWIGSHADYDLLLKSM